MKRTILSWVGTLVLLLLGLAYQVQAQCSGTKPSECFEFTFKGATSNTDGTVTIAFGVKVICEHDLSYVAFELPSDVTASSYTGPAEKVENSTNSPFYSIKFETGSGYKNGNTANFTYTVPSAGFGRMTKLRAEAKAATTVGTVEFDLNGCSPTGGDCSESQPGDIEGPVSPCPGETVEYSIASGYDSYEWDVPRAQDGTPVLGWEIIGSNTNNSVSVKVGMKSGTMRVKVQTNGCSSKEANLEVNPGNSVAVSIEGATSFCTGDVMVFRAKSNSANGTANTNFDFMWSVPTGWTIVSGRTTNTLIVRAGASAGQVSVMMASNVSKNNTICEAGEAMVEVTPKPSCNPCAKPALAVDAPTEVCASGDKIYTFTVTNRDVTGKVKYQFFLPEEFQIVSQGYGYVNIKVNDAQPASTLFVTVVAVNGNNCGAEAVCLPVEVESCPTEPNCTDPAVTLVLPETICNLADEPYRIYVQNPQADYTYEFNLPEGFIIVEEGFGFVMVRAFIEDDLGKPLTVRMIATNNCSSTVKEATVVVKECEPGNPLPVTLTKFDGVSRNGAVELTWSTASEIDNDRFEVERSANGREFQKVGEVKGNGNSSAQIDYTYTDRSATSGTVFYRLKQVDFDNDFEYSKVIAVTHRVSASAATVSVYPNPVTDGKLSIRFQNSAKGKATVRLVDMSGRVLHTNQVNNIESELGVNLIGLNLKPGVYLLSVTANGQSTTQRVMVR